MRVLIAVLTLSAVILLGIAAVEAAVPAPSHGRAHGVVWAGQTFASRADFARWLRSQGTSYRAWARRHPVQAGLRSSRSPKAAAQHTRWGPGVLARIAAVLAALALGLALVRRRWPGIGAAAAHLIGVMGRRGAATLGAGARMALHWSALAAQRSMARATAATVGAGHRTGGSAARRLGVVGLRDSAAAEAGARTRRRLAALRAQRSTALASAAVFSARRRRSELAWYLTTALLAAGMGVVVTVWLNGG
jgi:hypothetical protein